MSARAQDLLVSSPIQWFVDHADEVIDAIANESGITHNMFRLDSVQDATLHRRIPNAAQRLIRWSDRGPEEVFVCGFMPRIDPRQHNDSLPPTACDLRRYVHHNKPSIFVGTTQPYRTTDGGLTSWRRRVTRRNFRRYEYDIFAYGGVAVNRVLGHHRHQRQHEIAFPGGIRPEMIRYSREYEGTRIVRVYENPNFDFTVNPHAPHPSILPTLPPPHANPPVLSLRSGDDLQCLPDDDDFPHGDGEAIADAYDTPLLHQDPLFAFSCFFHAFSCFS